MDHRWLYCEMFKQVVQTHTLSLGQKSTVLHLLSWLLTSRVETQFRGLAKVKGEAPVSKFIINFKQLTCNHCKEIYQELSLQSVKN